MIQSHAVIFPEARQEGGSAIAECGKEIVRTHWIAFTEMLPFSMNHEVRLHWTDIGCFECRYHSSGKTGYMYAAIEEDEYKLLKSKGRIHE